MYRLLGCLVLGAVVGGSLLSAAPSPTAAGDTPSTTSASSPDGRYEGVGSCASTACHGNTEGRIKQGEYLIWMERDPHRNAYAVLLNERSQRIIRNLGEKTPAQRNNLCLVCHATNPPPNERAESFSIEEGVGCESCHGPAGNWRNEHFLPSWKRMSPAEKAARGMHDTKDLVVRVQECVKCHIGAQDREVNHDLIAAGHPRMDFEYGLFTAKLPKHWYEQDEKARHPDFEARVWLIGQAASAKAAVDLLKHRAERKNPWPEFAEYACFSCHHDLHKELTPHPVTPGEAPPRVGSLLWGNWYYSMTDLLKDVGAASANEQGALKRLEDLMRSPVPDPNDVVKWAGTASQEFQTSLAKIHAQSYDAAQIRRLLADVAGRPAPASWDEAAQQYLAVAALYNGLTDLDPRRRDPAIRKSVGAILGVLDVHSVFDSPPKFQPLFIREQMQIIRNRVGQ